MSQGAMSEFPALVPASQPTLLVPHSSQLGSGRTYVPDLWVGPRQPAHPAGSTLAHSS